MKKTLFCILAALFLAAGSAWADEGMWLLPLLQKMNSEALKQAGCRLTPEQIYSINNTCIKDAVVQFGGGCTGEIVSDKGLLLTNHHCGYSSIQKLSTVEHNYLADGFWAMSLDEELPVEGLTVTFLEYMEDVTEDVQRMAKKFNGNMEAACDVISTTRGWEFPNCEVEVVSFYDENIYYLVVYKVFKDVRFVGAPPSSIGKFGADTDNWMWPRHTCDFSMFRVYSDKNGNPAEYSEENVPYSPKNHLKVSVKGVQEGDFTMIMGYPGRTTRFQTSPELQFQLDQNDIRIAARTIRQNVLMEDMLADPKVKIQYASKYSSSSNGWKKWQGMKLAFEKLDILGRAQEQEKEFTQWVNENGKRKKKYGSAMKEISESIAALREKALARTMLVESFGTIELVNAPLMLMRINAQDSLSYFSAVEEVADKFYKDYSVSTDRKVAKEMIKYYRQNSKPKYYPLLRDDFNSMNIDNYVDRMFEGSMFTSKEKLLETLRSVPYPAINSVIRKDPVFDLTKTFVNLYNQLYEAISEYYDTLYAARTSYTAGLMEWKDGQPSYPDANFTMRLTWGSVKSYSPKDAVIYKYYTTLDGVMEKEDPNNWEFVVPEKLKELWKAKDFGEYAREDGKMPTCFLSNNDITGGNSGSPIMNADGELIGLAFDGNWESMSSDVMFEPDLQRCINVDIRYVLFIIDKFGGARYLIDEMDIVR